MKKLLISVVIPVYSGEKYIKTLVSLLEKIKLKWESEYCPLKLEEIIMVDDASVDNSSYELKKISTDNDLVHVVTLSKNYGQHFATVAGILYTSGDWVITMDEDLQHDPEYIFEMLKIAVTESKDIVYAYPVQQVHFSWIRDFGSKFYKKIISFLTNNPNIRHFNSFRVVRGNIARAAASVCGHEMYIDIVFEWFTNRVGVFPVKLTDKRYKKDRTSGYNLKKLLSHARRLFVSAQSRFLRIGIAIGMVSIFISILYSIIIFFLFLFFPYLIKSPGWASLMIAILFLEVYHLCF